MRMLCAAVVFAAGAARAQELLYDNPVALVSSSRLVGMAGAAVGLAENAESMPFNPAAVAQRSPHRARGFDFDITFDVLLNPVSTMRDVENDPNTPGTVAPVEGQLGGFVQFKRFGIGAYGRFSTRDICLTAMPCGNNVLSATAGQAAIVFGFNALRDQLVFGGGFLFATAAFNLAGQAFNYRGIAVAGGALWRPAFWPFRVGISGQTQTNGGSDFDMMKTPTLAGRPVFKGIVAPARVSFGASARFGEGAWRYNRLSLSALKELPEDFNAAEVPHDLEPDDPRPPGRFLVSLQLDLYLPVSGATTLTTFIQGTAPVAAGDSLALVPRLGTESEAIDHRLRLRVGGYLEPAVVAGSKLRPHGTGGFEVFLLHLLFDWSVSAAVDLAPRYFSMGIGLGWWS